MKNNFIHLFCSVIIAGSITFPKEGFCQSKTVEEGHLKLTSSAFNEGENIPGTFTCKGDNTSPELSWSGVPTGTKSLALIVEDPDAPRGTYTHWTVYNIPATKKGLPSGAGNENKNDLTQGRNGFGKIGYGGPCPPQGNGPHRYFFKLFALDTVLALPTGASKEQLESTMQRHVLDQAALMGRYEVE